MREDLRRMGCAGLLTVPWGFQEETMVRELMDNPPVQFLETVRAHPEKWSRKTWQTVYDFRKDGCGLTNRKDDFARVMFDEKVDAKEGYSVEDIKDKCARAIIAFLLPIFYPEKPHRLTITWANTIISSFQGKREVD